VYYDDFSIEKLDNIEFNGGFERFGDMETPLGLDDVQRFGFFFIDEIDYDGKTSAHIVREDYVSSFTMTSLAKTAYVPRDRTISASACVPKIQREREPRSR